MIRLSVSDIAHANMVPAWRIILAQRERAGFLVEPARIPTKQNMSQPIEEKRRFTEHVLPGRRLCHPGILHDIKTVEALVFASVSGAPALAAIVKPGQQVLLEIFVAEAVKLLGLGIVTEQG